MRRAVSFGFQAAWLPVISIAAMKPRWP
jgi:hypothetical protein